MSTNEKIYILFEIYLFKFLRFLPRGPRFNKKFFFIRSNNIFFYKHNTFGIKDWDNETR